jgi:arylsulfatase A-like enzyme
VRPLPHLAAVAAAALLAACAPPREEVALRFIAEPAQELYGPGAVIASRPVVVWDLGDPAEAGQWRAGGAAEGVRQWGGGLQLLGDRSFFTLIRDVRLRAGRVDSFDLTLGRTRGVGVELWWARAGESWSEERRVSAALDGIPSQSETTLSFPVAGHPRWEGTIRRLRLTFSVPPSRQPLIRRLAAVAEEVDPGALAAAAGRPWLAELGGEVRNALPVPPGVPIERELTVPEGARLAFGYGLTAPAGREVHFRAVFAGAEGGEVEIFAAAVGDGDAGRWLSASADLGSFAGARGTLRLETAAGEGADPYPLATALPLWGAPEVIAPAAGGDRPERPSVVLVSIDTLRADGLSLYGNPRPTSPRIDRWARRHAAVFDQAVAAAPWTLPAHVTMLTGVGAHRHGVNYDAAAPASLDTLAERLRATGYATLAVTAGGYLDPSYGLVQGFDRYHHFLPDRREDSTELETGVANALALIEEHRDRPFFLFFHTYEVHAPYRLRQPWFARFAGYAPNSGARPDSLPAGPENGFVADRRFVAEPLEAGGPPPPERTQEELAVLARDLYDAAVGYTDSQVARLLDALYDHGLGRRTVVVVTSDHGEMMGEHSLAGHAYLYDENLLVPLIVAGPGERGAGRRIGTQVTQADLLPTILELAGLEAPRAIDGRSLVPLLDGAGAASRPAISYSPKSNRGASLRLGGRLKHLLQTAVWPPAAGGSALYDLRADPGELHPETAVRGSDLYGRLAGELDAGYRGLRLTVANAGPGPLTGELRGPSVSPTGLQALDLSCACLTWRGQDVARLEVPAGERFTLRLEDAAGGALEVVAELAGAGAAGRAEHGFDLVAPEAPQELAWDGAGWRAGRIAAPAAGDPEPPATGFLLWWRGEPPRAGGSVSGEDAELRERLRALGYID